MHVGVCSHCKKSVQSKYEKVSLFFPSALIGNRRCFWVVGSPPAGTLVDIYSFLCNQSDHRHSNAIFQNEISEKPDKGLPPMSSSTLVSLLTSSTAAARWQSVPCSSPTISAAANVSFSEETNRCLSLDSSFDKMLVALFGSSSASDVVWKAQKPAGSRGKLKVFISITLLSSLLSTWYVGCWRK